MKQTKGILGDLAVDGIRLLISIIMAADIKEMDNVII